MWGLMWQQMICCAPKHPLQNSHGIHPKMSKKKKKLKGVTALKIKGKEDKLPKS